MQSTSQSDSCIRADTPKSSDEVFEEMLDKYYTKLDKDAGAEEPQPEIEDKVRNPIQYYSDKSSTYYRENKIKIKDDFKNFKSRVAESLTDYRSHYSDWRNNDF